MADSAGVQVVTLRFGDDGPPSLHRVSGPPVLEIGLAEGEPAYELSQVVGAATLPKGGVAVANRGTSEIRFFGPDGAHGGSAGRSGEGPGEFRRIHWIAVHHDTVLVYDWSLGRVTVLDGSGGLVSTERTLVPPLTNPAGLLGGTSKAVHWDWVGPEREIPGVRPSTVEIRISEWGVEGYEAVEQIPFVEEAYVEFRGRVTRAFRPLAPQADVVARGAHVFALTWSEPGSIRVYDAEGSLVRVIRISVPDQAISQEDVEGWIAGWFARFDTGMPEVEEWWRHGFGELRPPAHLPTFRSLLTDTEGNVCAERYPLRLDAPTVYWCFTPDGHFLRALELPAGLVREGPFPFSDVRPEIGPDHVLGVWEDELGVQRVRRFHLEQP